MKRLGREKTSPFEVQVVLDSGHLNLSNVGYGVSQSLPIMVEMIMRTKGTCFSIQQPEVHLHPQAQAAIGDAIFEMARRGKMFLVETHSDFVIDRFRVAMREARGMEKKMAAQILFFERRRGKNHTDSIRIDENGEVPSTAPKAYREFFLKENKRLLGY
ncbi:MAG: AAA family ATPase [Candidatus Hadarchaeum sp.]|nr:AAA family ATPase [Candidatus Hadarchaeum sp.]